jgi:hypothetical protein
MAGFGQEDTAIHSRDFFLNSAFLDFPLQYNILIENQQVTHHFLKI